MISGDKLVTSCSRTAIPYTLADSHTSHSRVLVLHTSNATLSHRDFPAEVSNGPVGLGRRVVPTRFPTHMLGLLALAVAPLLVGAAPTWHIIDSDIATIDTNVAFISDSVGYAATTVNGVGPEVLVTCTFSGCCRIRTRGVGVAWPHCLAVSAAVSRRSSSL